MEALDILKKYWGHTSFRLNQKEVIDSIINKQDTLALLPTAGGKSICFQIPALIEEGICIVITPLLSLMRDQTNYLKSKGIKSIAISSMMNKNNIETALTNCIYGNVKFLYLSPEKINDKNILDKILKMNVNLIAVDEAHCISQWGHNFRPSYRLISKLRDIKKDVPILALTATANKNVTKDIQENLNFKKENIIRSSFFRKNLSYVVVNCKSKKDTLIKLVNKIKSSIIIYVGSRKESKEISEFLKNKSYSVSPFHAGIDIKTRNKIQNDWIENKTRIIVATSAFGLGINKTDIRLVVHMNIPLNIEDYFQESGRAGRDGKTSYSFILYDEKDIKINYKTINERNPEIKDLEYIYQKICDYLQVPLNTHPEEDFKFEIGDFCKRYKLDIKQTFSTLNYLQREELIKLYDSEKTSSQIKIVVSNSELYKFQIANSFYEGYIQILLRDYQNIFGNYTRIDENSIQKKINKPNTKVRDVLKKLEERGILKYRENKTGTYLKFTQIRKDANNLGISENKIKIDRERALDKYENVIRYIKNKKECRSLILLKYFDEIKSEKCGICDYCIELNKKKINDQTFNNISEKIIKILEAKENSIDEITNKINEYEIEKIEKVINYLFDNDIIYKFGNKFVLNKKN